MNAFEIGQTVRVTGTAMKGVVGTVVHLDELRGTYLVRVGGATQNYFAPEDLELYTA